MKCNEWSFRLNFYTVRLYLTRQPGLFLIFFCMNRASGAESHACPDDLQSSTLPLCYDCPLIPSRHAHHSIYIQHKQKTLTKTATLPYHGNGCKTWTSSAEWSKADELLHHQQSSTHWPWPWPLTWPCSVARWWVSGRRKPALTRSCNDPLSGPLHLLLTPPHEAPPTPLPGDPICTSPMM